MEHQHNTPWETESAVETALYGQLNASLPSPSPELHDTIVRRVRQTPQLVRRSYTRVTAALAAVLCLCLVGIALIEGGFSPSYAPDADIKDMNMNEAADFDTPQSEDASDRIESTVNSPQDGAADADTPLDTEESENADSTVSPEEEATAPSQAPSAAPDVPALMLPDTLTLHFTQDGNAWVAKDGDTVYRLYFGAGNTLQLYDADGCAAYGAYDDQNRVELNATQTYRGTLTQADAKSYVLTLTRAD